MSKIGCLTNYTYNLAQHLQYIYGFTLNVYT